MPENTFSKELLAFIVEEIQSIQQLEILLLLRSFRDRSWSALQVQQELRTSELFAESCLAALQSRGFLRGEKKEGVNDYQYSPANKKKERLLEQVTAEYKTRKGKVIDVIYSKARIKGFLFASAFNLGKDDDNG